MPGRRIYHKGKRDQVSLQVLGVRYFNPPADPEGDCSLQAKVDEALIQSCVGLREGPRGKFARPAGRYAARMMRRR
jgi:hypothetical protein